MDGHSNLIHTITSSIILVAKMAPTRTASSSSSTAKASSSKAAGKRASKAGQEDQAGEPAVLPMGKLLASTGEQEEQRRSIHAGQSIEADAIMLLARRETHTRRSCTLIGGLPRADRGRTHLEFGDGKVVEGDLLL